MAFVEAAAGVDDVFDAFELVLGEVGVDEGDELVEEEVVEVGEGFDGWGGGVGGHGDAGFEELVRGEGVVVWEGGCEGGGWRGGGGGGGWHVFYLWEWVGFVGVKVVGVVLYGGVGVWIDAGVEGKWVRDSQDAVSKRV